jgi:tRNA threonylcarbamoyl adenosine modification protein YeaZ
LCKIRLTKDDSNKNGLSLMPTSVQRNKMKKSLSNDLPSTNTTILALEASASQLSIALMRDGCLLATRQHLAAHGHAVGIVPLTIETLHEAGETFDAITHVATGCGPGSFTGIRVTLAAAKGFCMAYQAVGVGISGLQALAGAASDAAPHVTSACLTLADTRRGTLYAQIFDGDAQPASHIFESSVTNLPRLIDGDLLASGLRIVGAERAAVADSLNTAGVSTTLPPVEDMPTASMIAHLAAAQIKRGETTPLEPLYLADPRLGPQKKSG